MKLNLPARSKIGLARWNSTRQRSMLAIAAAIVAMLTVAGCASHNRKVGDVGDQPMIVHLTNDLAPPSDVNVYAVTQDGIRRLVGDVPPNKDRAMKIPSDVPRGTIFRLVAERGALGRPVVSQPITATTTGLIIDWSLQANAIWYPESSN
jgi:hypothetical protein